MTPDIETKAKELYAAQTAAWTGAPWDWEKASDEIKAKYREHARVGSRPPLPEEI